MYKLQNLKLVTNGKQIINSGQQNYMDEVSRLLIASPRLRPMEMFLLILLSSLIGFDAPYFFYYFVFTR